MTPEEKEQQKRKILFVPCRSKEQLHKWIHFFLGLDVPNCIVDPDSNSSPMDMLWETYSKALANDDPNFNRVLYFASRDSFKTLGAAILEVLAVVHLGRDVAHMAAIESQSKKSQQYVKKFMSRPGLRDFVVGNNQEIMWIVRYNDPTTGSNLSEKEFQALSEEARSRYIEVKNYIRVVICTKAGANSEHVPFFVVDEIDVVQDASAYEEAKMIPAPINGLMPITVLTSTRKYSFGLVQGEIDNQLDEDGNERLLIRHWNIIDVTEACPASRHLPDEPRVPIFVDDATLKAVSAKKHLTLIPEQQAKYVEHEGYAGCLTNCRIFAACKGRLATEQKSKSPLLKPIAHTTNQFLNSNISIPTALAQLLCRKPSTEGLVYPNFDRDVHMLTAAEMAEKITGVPQRPDFSKNDLIMLVKARQMEVGSGMDFGYTHNFAVVTAAIDGYRAFVFDVIAAPELELAQQVDTCNGQLRHMNPSIWADPESPSSIATLRGAGFRMREWKKLGGSVVAGINLVRYRMMPTMGAEPLLFLLKGDPGCELLAKRLRSYHFKIDAAGRITDVPDEKDDDECDALRYLVMNRFAPAKGRVKTAGDSKAQASSTAPGVYTKENFFQKIMEEQGITSTGEQALIISKGRFKCIM